MGFFSDIKNGFKVKSLMKTELKDVKLDNAFSSFLRVMNNVDYYDFGLGTKVNMVKGIKKEYIKKISSLTDSNQLENMTNILIDKIKAY